MKLFMKEVIWTQICNVGAVGPKSVQVWGIILSIKSAEKFLRNLVRFEDYEDME